MSNNISYIKIKESNLYTTGRRLREISEKFNYDFPESNFIDNIRSSDDDNDIEIFSLDWSGIGSGLTFETFKLIVKEFYGYAKFCIIWDDGETDYYILKDGKLSLVDPQW